MPCNSKATVLLRLSPETAQVLMANPDGLAALGRWLGGKTGAPFQVASGDLTASIFAGGHTIRITKKQIGLTGLNADQWQADLETTARALSVVLGQRSLVAAVRARATVTYDGRPADPKLAARGVRQLVISL